MSNGIHETVGDYIKKLQDFQEDWPVHVVTHAGGGIDIEHREIRGLPVVVISGRNGENIGEKPLTEREYEVQAKEFLRLWNQKHYSYTSIHGDHMMYDLSIPSCYGVHFDRRIVERMVLEGLIPGDQVDIERVRRIELD